MFKNLMSRYNYAFGYVKSFFFFIGAVGGSIWLVWGIIDIFTKGTIAPLSERIIPALIWMMISAVILLLTRRKCPEDKKGIVGLIFSMTIVGLCSILVLALWFFKLIFHISSSGSSSSDTTKFANGYERDSDGQWCSLYSVNMGYAYLMDGSGNMIGVRPHGSDGLVIDDAGNLYRPS